MVSTPVISKPGMELQEDQVLRPDLTLPWIQDQHGLQETTSQKLREKLSWAVFLGSVNIHLLPTPVSDLKISIGHRKDLGKVLITSADYSFLNHKAKNLKLDPYKKQSPILPQAAYQLSPQAYVINILADNCLFFVLIMYQRNIPFTATSNHAMVNNTCLRIKYVLLRLEQKF